MHTHSLFFKQFNILSLRKKYVYKSMKILLATKTGVEVYRNVYNIVSNVRMQDTKKMMCLSRSLLIQKCYPFNAPITCNILPLEVNKFKIKIFKIVKNLFFVILFGKWLFLIHALRG